MSTPQDNIIEKLESEIKCLNLEIFELKSELKITKSQLKEASNELQKQGYLWWWWELCRIMEETPQGKIIVRLKAKMLSLLKKRLFDARQRVMELEQELHDWIDKASN